MTSNGCAGAAPAGRHLLHTGTPSADPPAPVWCPAPRSRRLWRSRPGCRPPARARSRRPRAGRRTPDAGRRRCCGPVPHQLVDECGRLVRAAVEHDGDRRCDAVRQVVDRRADAAQARVDPFLLVTRWNDHPDRYDPAPAAHLRRRTCNRNSSSVCSTRTSTSGRADSSRWVASASRGASGGQPRQWTTTMSAPGSSAASV
jgi:hypothetical protein